MLVLRRKAGEAIVLNGVITIHVLAVEGERVKLGISAPPEVVIVRSELLENQGGWAGHRATHMPTCPRLCVKAAHVRTIRRTTKCGRSPETAWVPQQRGYSRYTTPRPAYPAEPAIRHRRFPAAHFATALKNLGNSIAMLPRSKRRIGARPDSRFAGRSSRCSLLPGLSRFLSIHGQLCYTRSIMRSSMPASAAPCKARGRLSALLEDLLVSAFASSPVTFWLFLLARITEVFWGRQI